MRKNGFDNIGFNQTLRYIGYLVDVCSQLHKDFRDYNLLGVSDQLVVGIVFSCF